MGRNCGDQCVLPVGLQDHARVTCGLGQGVAGVEFEEMILPNFGVS